MKTIVTFVIALFLSIVNGIGASYPLGSPTPSLADIYGNPIRIGYGLGVTNRWLYTTNSGGGGASLQYYTVATEAERYALPDLHNGDVVFQPTAGPTADYNQNWLLVDSNYSTNAAGWVALPPKYMVIYSGGTVEVDPGIGGSANYVADEIVGAYSWSILPSPAGDVYDMAPYGYGLDGVFNLQPFGATLTYIEVSDNNLTEFDTTGLTAVDTLYLYDNLITGTFSAPDSSAMTDLDISNNLFTDFDGTGLTSLIGISVNGNPLTNFFGGDMTSKTSLDFSNLDEQFPLLETFTAGNMTALAELYLGASALDVTNVSLKTVDISEGSSLTDFDVKYISSLTNIVWPTNNSVLINVDLRGCRSLPYPQLALTNYASLSSVFMDAHNGSVGSEWDGMLWAIVGLTGCRSFVGVELPAAATVSFSSESGQLTSFNGQGLTSLTTLDLTGQESSLTNFVSGNMGLSGFNIDLTGFTNLTTLNISGSTNITNILAVTTALTSASVNNTLTNLAWFGLSNGVVDLSGGTSATTNAAGSAAVDTLVSRGWSVNNN